MPKHGKLHRKASEGLDRTARYRIDEALQLLIERKYAKFDESVDLAISLGVDPRHSDQMVRGSVELPHGTGKTVRVCAFCAGEKAQEAQDAGADFVGGEELVQKIADEGWLEFDKAVATPDMMKFLGRVAKVLGPRGLMPNPKTGTVTMDLAKAVKSIKAGKVDYRVEKAGIVHGTVGRISFGPEKLRDNAMAFVESVVRAKPSAAKGRYLKGIALSSTMGPGLKLDLSSLEMTGV